MTTNDAQSPSIAAVQRLLGRWAALLTLGGLLTGLFAGAAMTGKVHADGHAALASHLNALMATFLLAAVGWTMPMLSYGEAGRRRLALVFIASSLANWLITAAKALLMVGGLDLIGAAANDGVFIALQVGVVLPSLAAAGAWVYGFRGSPSSPLRTAAAGSPTPARPSPPPQASRRAPLPSASTPQAARHRSQVRCTPGAPRAGNAQREASCARSPRFRHLPGAWHALPKAAHG
jgi:hydroxylaminobenzene mutase